MIVLFKNDFNLWFICSEKHNFSLSDNFYTFTLRQPTLCDTLIKQKFI